MKVGELSCKKNSRREIIIMKMTSSFSSSFTTFKSNNNENVDENENEKNEDVVVCDMDGGSNVWLTRRRREEASTSSSAKTKVCGGRSWENEKKEEVEKATPVVAFPQLLLLRQRHENVEANREKQDDQSIISQPLPPPLPATSLFSTSPTRFIQQYRTIETQPPPPVIDAQALSFHCPRHHHHFSGIITKQQHPVVVVDSKTFAGNNGADFFLQPPFHIRQAQQQPHIGLQNIIQSTSTAYQQHPQFRRETIAGISSSEHTNPSSMAYPSHSVDYQSARRAMVRSMYSSPNEYASSSTSNGGVLGGGGGRQIRSPSHPRQLVIQLPPVAPSPTIIGSSSLDESSGVGPSISLPRMLKLCCCLSPSSAGTSSSSYGSEGADSASSRNNFCVLGMILLGQLMSLCLGGTAISSQLLANNGFNAPAFQAFGNYFLLALCYGSRLLFRNDDDRNIGYVMKTRGWRYFLLALIDVEANYLIVKAYQYTNLTSIQLLDCFTIPVVMILSWVFLSTRYLKIHFFGVFICFIGIAMIIYTDATHGKGLEGGSDRVLGDALCLCAACLYSICNVSEEFLVKQRDRSEYLGLVGVFGFLISAVQLSVFESITLLHFRWTLQAVAMYALFTISMFIFYSIVSFVMQKSSALMFNLSVLTADFYALLAGIFIFQYSFNFFYLASFVVVLCGSIIYSFRRTLAPKRPLALNAVENGVAEANLQNQQSRHIGNGLMNQFCACCCPFLTSSSENGPDYEVKDPSFAATRGANGGLMMMKRVALDSATTTMLAAGISMAGEGGQGPFAFAEKMQLENNFSNSKPPSISLESDLPLKSTAIL